MILGIDNVFFDVANLETAIPFFEKLGFSKKMSFPHIPAVLFSVGEEESGLMLCQKSTPNPSKLWVETENALQEKEKCAQFNIKGEILETAVGTTFEVKDDSGNTIGFADYSKKPELSRKRSSQIKKVALDYSNEVWKKKDLNAIQKFIDKDVVIHSLLGDYYGQNAMIDVVEAWLKGFPDLIVDYRAVTTSDDLVTIHWHATGIHQGIFKGIPPAGKTVSYNGVTIYRIKDDRIVEYWAYLDMQSIFDQISD